MSHPPLLKSAFVPTVLAIGLLTAAVPAQLAGSYTINPLWPAFPGNFPSLAAATAALASQGIAGPVTFEVFDDAGPYTEASPFVTTSGPFAPNTAVLVLGQWVGSSATNRVTFRAAPGEAPILDATARSMGVFWGGADYVTIEGFEIRNAIHDAISLYSEASHGVANNAIIRRCVLHDCGGTGVTVYGNSSFPVDTLIESNVFYSLQRTNAGSFSTTGRFGYVTTRRSTNTRVVHNTFVADTGTGGSFCVLGAYPSGTTEIPYGEFSNNVVFKTAGAGKPIVRIQSPANTSAPAPAICESNCFYDLTASPFALWGTSAGTTVATLLDWQTTSQKDLTSTWADPQFLDFGARDFRIQVTSPCLAAATIDFGPTTDIDGQPRLASRDRGADELSGAQRLYLGAGCSGSNSLPSRLSTNTWPFLGNAGFALHADAVTPNQPVFFAASFGAAPTPIQLGTSGCAIWIDPSTAGILPGFAAADPFGHANLLVPLPPDGSFASLNIFYQAIGLDPGTSLGATTSNALQCVLGF